MSWNAYFYCCIFIYSLQSTKKENQKVYDYHLKAFRLVIRPKKPPLKSFTDQINRVIQITDFPQRIISLVPSITELLIDLGLEKRLVACTRFCPPAIRQKKVLIGGTKDIAIKHINSLASDLVLASKEENVKEQIEELTAPVWVSDVATLKDAKAMILAIGKLTNTEVCARKLIDNITFPTVTSATRPRVVYLIWRKPYMTIGGDTFINELLTIAGFENVFKDKKRYPIISLEDIEQQKPDYIFLSTEPFPFKEKYFEEFASLAPPVLVDGEMFSWFGSHLVKANAYFEVLQKELKAL